MDVFAHAFWTNAVFYKKYQTEKTQRYLAVLFGHLPDLLAFTPAFFYLVFSGTRGGIEAFNSGVWVYRYAAFAYNFTHSLALFLIGVLTVFIIRKFLGLKSGFYWPMWGWCLHILIDIPSHKGFYETPFLFPFSGYKFDHGISWGHPLFMIINYSALILVYLFWFFVLRKNKTQNKI